MQGRSLPRFVFERVEVGWASASLTDVLVPSSPGTGEDRPVVPVRRGRTGSPPPANPPAASDDDHYRMKISIHDRT
jgi:hypothetical protein